MNEHPVCIGGVLALILLQASTASAQQVVRRAPPPPARVELRVPKTVVPMELFGGRPVVSVRVNGKGPFPAAPEPPRPRRGSTFACRRQSSPWSYSAADPL